MEVLCRSTSIREDFIKIKNNFTLLEALTDIQEKRLAVGRYPVTVYKRVIDDEQIKSFDALTYIKNKMLTNCNSLEVLEQKCKSLSDNIHQVILNSKSITCTQELLKLSEFNLDLENNTGQLYALQVLNKYFQDFICSEFSALHIENDLISLDIKVHLKFNKSMLLNTEPVLGMNIPKWTISSPGSIVPFNNYNRDLAHVNILLQGKSRIYVIIPSPFVKYFIEKIHSLMKKSCKLELLHRPGCVINPLLLLKWGIPLQFYIQQPGDLIFINRNGLFYAIDSGWNFVESINFSYNTSIMNLSQISCQCENKDLIIRPHVLTESGKKLRNKSKKRIYKCAVKNCIGGKAIYDKKTFYAHCIKEHDLKPFPCWHKNCTKSFTRKHDTTRHFEIYYKKTVMNRKVTDESLIKRKEKVVCDICDKSISRRNLRRHMTQRHKLTSYLLQENMQKHLQQCSMIIFPNSTADNNYRKCMSYKELKMDHSLTASQIVHIKHLDCNETQLNTSRETKYNLLKENLLVEIQKLKEELKKIKEDKIHDNFILKLELEKAKQTINQLKIDQNKKIVQIEMLQDELQKQKNMKYCKVLHFQLKLENTQKKLNEFSIERDDIQTLMVELQKNLVAAKAEIEKIQLETVSNQLRFCKSFGLISKSSNDNTVYSKPHKYCLRNHLHK